MSTLAAILLVLAVACTIWQLIYVAMAIPLLAKGVSVTIGYAPGVLAVVFAIAFVVAL